ncbi:MAG: hypothetical protein NVSMB3_09490 [Acidobacteriaceae bacterium]
MSDSTQFDPDDLALYAMQLLSKDEEAQARQKVDSSQDLRRELAEIHGDLAIYATTVEMHSPPSMARERLLTQIGRERKIRSIERSPDQLVERGTARSHESQERSADLPPRGTEGYGAGPGTVTEIGRHPGSDSRRLTEDDLPRQSSEGIGRVIPWLGWAVAAGLAVTTGNFYHESQTMRGSMAQDHAELARLSADAAAARQLMDTLKDPAATRVTLTRSKEAAVPQGKVTYVAEKGALLFVANNFAPLDTSKVYELWLIPANGQAPVPAGTFHPDARGNASLVLPPLPSGLIAKAFGITVEPEGGAQTPTMPIILAGTAAGV